MKYLLLTLLVSVFSVSNSYSQWKLKKANSQDLIFDIISVKSRGLALKLKVLDTNTVVYLKGNYFTDENPFITLDLYTNNGVKSYSFVRSTRYYDDIVILTHDLKKSKMLKDLKQSYAIKVSIYNNAENNSVVMLNTENYLNLSDKFTSITE